MDGPSPGNTSGTARLLLGAPSYAVGWQERVLIPNAAATAGFTYKADGRWYERVIAVTFNLVTDAVVANRFAELFLQDADGVVVTAAPVGSTVVASTTLNVFLTADAPSYSGGGAGGTFGKMPDMLIPPGWKWVCQVFSADAGDQLTGIVVTTQRFPSDAVEIQANS
jgi:hypothetical protein